MDLSNCFPSQLEELQEPNELDVEEVLEVVSET